MKNDERSFSHIDAATGNPSMVDVSEKQVTKRTATARSIVVPGREIMQQLREGDIHTKKGPVFQTAIIAGIMAAKKTSELIPLCHPLALENCKVHIKVSGADEITIECTASITSKTGVEMEALTGATVAALTVYDMCKALSHDIVIKETRLITKTGGKSDFIAGLSDRQRPELNGLILSGGESSRMGTDKGALVYHGKSQRAYLFDLLSGPCRETFVSCRQEQTDDTGGLPFLADRFLGLGPLSGILTAFQSQPDKAWLSIACDLPYLTERTIRYLVQHRNPSKAATAFYNAQGDFAEPLLTIWEPRSYPLLLNLLSKGCTSPKRALSQLDVELVEAPEGKDLQNINHSYEYDIVKADLENR